MQSAASKSTIAVHDLATMDAAARARLLVRAEEDLSLYIERVRPIIAAVKAEGDVALARFARQFDKAEIVPEAIRVPEADFDAAFAAVSPNVVEAINFAADNIRRFHEAQMPEMSWLREMRPGLFVGERWLPIDSVACYVPRGKGAFPSVVLMTAIPAKVAGVPRVVMITPPGPDGKVDAGSLVAARAAGISEVYRCGGAQGIAAVAYGTSSVPRCHKIVGPGSSYVVAAKKLLSDVIDPGIPAGPSEAIVLADATADGRLAALDLLIEAEHGPDSSCFLVTPSRKVAQQAIAAIPGFWAQMTKERVAFSATVLSGARGGIVIAPDMAAALAFVNDYAPEHLMIHAEDPKQYLDGIRHAGEILLGPYTPMTLANFVLGPNAVLPTSGAARTASPLSVFDYLKRSGLAQVTGAAYPELARQARCLALYEGFDAHANAVSETRDAIMDRS